MKKLYYSISEVCEIINEEQHILRYWEKEFDIIKPRKNRGGNRIYSPDDLEIIKIIQQLIRNNNFNIKQTKEILSKYPSKSKIVSEKSVILAHKIEGKKNGKFNTKSLNSMAPLLSNSDKAQINQIFDEIFSQLNKYS